MNIIDKRDVRTARRKIAKKEYDSMIKLSAKTDNMKKLSADDGTYRLLDEGAVVYANGDIDFYIQKGTLAKYMEALPDDYEGTINLGHIPFAQFPIILGTWTKDDLTLVDIGDGRQGLDVRLRLDDGNSIVQDLRRASYTVGLSAEFGYSINEEASREYGLDIVDDLFITDFAIVGEAGNVGSSDVRLNVKGESMKINDLAKKLNAEKGKATSLADLTKLLDSAIEKKDEKQLEAETEGAEEAAEISVETVEAEESTDGTTEGSTEETVEENPEGEATFDQVSEMINLVVARNKELEQEVADLKAQLAAKENDEKAFIEKFKSLSVSLSTERKKDPETNVKSAYTDGIGA